jgi:hypothetical protein
MPRVTKAELEAENARLAQALLDAQSGWSGPVDTGRPMVDPEVHDAVVRERDAFETTLRSILSRCMQPDAIDKTIEEVRSNA